MSFTTPSPEVMLMAMNGMENALCRHARNSKWTREARERGRNPWVSLGGHAPFLKVMNTDPLSLVVSNSVTSAPRNACGS